MLDKLSPANRHMVIALLGSLLGELTNQLPNVNLPATIAPIAGALLASAVLRVSALTKQYGIKG
jgi:hypothetical protein